MVKPKKVTIREVAQAAGVSPTTVSLVYNKKGEIADATREHVLNIGKELGYEPGWMGRVFRTGRTHIIGVAVGHSDTELWDRTYLPYYRGIIAGAAVEGIEHGYAVTAVRTTSEGEIDIPIPLDGIILVDPSTDDPVVSQAISRGIPVVAEGGMPDTEDAHPLISNVTSKLNLAIPTALDIVTENGRRRPALITGSRLDNYTHKSETEYELWCRAHDMKPKVVRVGSELTPMEAARQLLTDTDEIQAIHALNETYAAPVLQLASEMNISIPDELGVSVAAEVTPRWTDDRLTYVWLDPVRNGAVCARALIHYLESNTNESVEVDLEVSTGGARSSLGASHAE